MNRDELRTDIREFCEERSWTQFHTSKELAIGLSTESNELLEMFRFKYRVDQEALLADAEKRADVEAELADVLFFVSICGSLRHRFGCCAEEETRNES